MNEGTNDLVPTLQGHLQKPGPMAEVLSTLSGTGLSYQFRGEKTGRHRERRGSHWPQVKKGQKAGPRLSGGLWGLRKDRLGRSW